MLEAGGTPNLSELRLHNGTIYRWNRPVYDIAGGVPHLRVENRLLAAGPTVVDTMANAAFYFGLVRALAESERPLWSQMSFSAAEENFHVAAQQGIDAQIYWPGVGQVSATELVLRRLLPAGPRRGWRRGASTAETSDRLLGIIEQRCLTGTNGAEWFVERMAAARATRTGTTRCGRRCWSTASGCTATSRCTPGTDPAQESRASPQPLPLRPTPVRGSRQPRRLTTTIRSPTPSSPAACGRRREPVQVQVLDVEAARAG